MDRRSVHFGVLRPDRFVSVHVDTALSLGRFEHRSEREFLPNQPSAAAAIDGAASVLELSAAKQAMASSRTSPVAVDYLALLAETVRVQFSGAALAAAEHRNGIAAGVVWKLKPERRGFLLFFSNAGSVPSPRLSTVAALFQFDVSS
jgi:hypothetical protein